MGRHGAKKGLLTKILWMALAPLLVVGIASILMFARYSVSMLATQQEGKLNSIGQATMASINSMYYGAYVLDEDGTCYKGVTSLSESEELLNAIHNSAGVESMIFVGNKMVASSGGQLSEHFSIPQEVLDNYRTEVFNYFHEYQDAGEDYYINYTPFFQKDGSLAGILCSAISSKEPKDEVSKKIFNLEITISIILVISVLLICFEASHMINALKEVNNKIALVAKGILTEHVNTKVRGRRDEIGALADSEEMLCQNLKNVVGNVKDEMAQVAEISSGVDGMASQMNITVEDVSRAVEGISAGATSQAENTQEAMEHVTKMGQLIEDMIDSIKRLSLAAEDMGSAEENAGKILDELNDAVDRTSGAVDSIAKQTESTNSAAQQIQEVAEFISSIAEQTNLLSLNASIEAARAGEAGRGFAVVASEIQKLAEQSTQSVSRIQEILDVLLHESQKTMDSMSTVSEAVSKQNSKIVETRQAIGNVNAGVRNSIQSIEQIQSGTDELGVSRNRVIEVIESLSAISEENAASTEETMASSEEMAATMNELASSANQLKGIADKVEDSLRVFKLTK